MHIKIKRERNRKKEGGRKMHFATSFEARAKIPERKIEKGERKYSAAKLEKMRSLGRGKKGLGFFFCV